MTFLWLSKTVWWTWNISAQTYLTFNKCQFHCLSQQDQILSCYRSEGVLSLPLPAFPECSRSESRFPVQILDQFQPQFFSVPMESTLLYLWVKYENWNYRRWPIPAAMLCFLSERTVGETEFTLQLGGIDKQLLGSGRTRNSRVCVEFPALMVACR